MSLEGVWKAILRRERLSWLILPAMILWLVSLLYRLGVRLFALRPQKRIRVGVPVLSVGNITVGGTGKTPMVEFLASYLINDGYRVGIVSSGYGRSVQVRFVEPGYRVQSRPTSETGDEVKLLSHRVPQAVFSVAQSKSDAAQALAGGGEVDVILVDDGFQHRRLHRDLDLVTYDAAIPPRLVKPFPAGVLREPRSALKRADILVLTRANFSRNVRQLQDRLRKKAPRAEFYRAQFEARELVGEERTWPVKYLEDKSVFAFAGIGNFDPFRRQVAALSAHLEGWLELSDHQEYDEETVLQLRALVVEYEPDVLVTTFKDWVKLPHFDFGAELYYLSQSIDLDPGEEKLISLICQRLNLVRRST